MFLKGQRAQELIGLIPAFIIPLNGGLLIPVKNSEILLTITRKMKKMLKSGRILNCAWHFFKREVFQIMKNENWSNEQQEHAIQRMLDQDSNDFGSKVTLVLSGCVTFTTL